MNILKNMDNIDELKVTLEQLSNYLTEFLGFEYKIKFDIKYSDIMKTTIEIVQESKKFLIPYVEQGYLKVFETINSELDTYLASKKTYIGDIGYLINKIAISLIFNDFNNGTQIKKAKTHDFIKCLQDISNMTYETKPVEMGIFYCQTDKDLELLKSNEKFNFIQMDACELKEFICSQKPLLKIIDNKNFTIVIDNNFLVKGIIKRKFKSKPILNVINNSIINKEKYLFINDLINEIEYMTKVQYSDDFCEKFVITTNKHKKKTHQQKREFQEFINNNKKELNKLFNEYCDFAIKLLEKEKVKINEELLQHIEQDTNIIYITIQNREIEFWFNDYFSICQKNCNWRIKNYVALAHEIFSSVYMNPNSLLTDKTDVITSEILKTREINSSHKEQTKQIIEEEMKHIIDISNKIFKLINNIKKMSINNEGALFVIITEQEYFDKEKDNLIEDNIVNSNYKKVIKNNDFEPCITMINDDTFQLIATVDGATLLSREFKVVSFSEMIKTQKFDKSKCGKIYGARTNGAVNATQFGTSIKVSEDGDIIIYRNVMYKDKNNKIIKQAEKVLSI